MSSPPCRVVSVFSSDMRSFGLARILRASIRTWVGPLLGGRARWAPRRLGRCDLCGGVGGRVARRVQGANRSRPCPSGGWLSRVALHVFRSFLYPASFVFRSVLRFVFRFGFASGRAALAGLGERFVDLAGGPQMV